jgi:hypothetical protein
MVKPSISLGKPGLMWSLAFDAEETFTETDFYVEVTQTVVKTSGIMEGAFEASTELE